MSQHVNYMQQSAELFKKFVEFNTLLKQCAIEDSILDLVAIRATQINGCGFINAWNRINIGSKIVPGAHDKAFGLKQAKFD